MRGRRAPTVKRGWVAVAIFAAGGVAWMAANWSAGSVSAPEAPEAAPAGVVAARFPAASLASADVAVATTIVGKRHLALFDPQPFAATAPIADLPATAPEPAAAAEPALPPPAARTVHAKPASVHRVANRPGFVLNDGQIASIKRRLNLTPDQERMWPAVEAALRNIAYAKAHNEPHRRGARASATQLASVDPESPEVQGLKSAAFPLIMSFSPEQKSEVRSLAHVMGLTKLAASF